ncbi:MAG TPA: hypothetical protein VGA80_01750, partial [Flavobacteriaceae bacterium]
MTEQSRDNPSIFFIFITFLLILNRLIILLSPLYKIALLKINDFVELFLKLLPFYNGCRRY